jgi:hypothetical protein
MYRPVASKLLLSSSTASDASHTAIIDTLGFDRITIGLHETTVAATTGFITLKIGEGDTTSAFTDVATALHGTAQAATATTVAQNYNVNVDCRTRKRYLLLTATPFTTKTLTSHVVYQAAELSGTLIDSAMVRAVADL